ncbi:hypothetical protein D9M70_574440 [compost metagenome]
MDAMNAVSKGSLRQPKSTAAINRAKIIIILSGLIVNDRTSRTDASQSRSFIRAKMAAKENAARTMSGKTADVIGPKPASRRAGPTRSPA